MPGTIEVSIVSPEKEVFKGQADMVVVPAFLGEMGILPGHMPVIAALRLGEVRVKIGAEIVSYVVDGGFVEVRNNVVRILTNLATPGSEFDAQKASAAISELEELLKKSELKPSEEERVKREIARNKAILRVLDRRH